MLPDYSSLSDAELNAKVSELIMDGKQGKWISDWNHTMEVVEKAREHDVFIEISSRKFHPHYEVCLFVEEGIYDEQQVEKENVQHAVCLAVLLAVSK